MVKSFLQRRSGLVLKPEQGRGLAAESLTGPSPHTFSPDGVLVGSMRQPMEEGGGLQDIGACERPVPPPGG